MLLLRIVALCAAASLAACSDTEAKPLEPVPLDMGAGARIDGSQDEELALLEALAPKDPLVEQAPEPEPEPDSEGGIKLQFNDLSLDELDDIQLEDLLDALLYPDEYEDAERIFPDQIQRLDKQQVALKGYMIPVDWDDKLVTEFMLVRDLLACCFGGAPQPDEWVSVKMPEGEGAEYFTFVPVIVQGTFHIAALEDEAGYAAGCFRMDGETVVKED